MTENKRVREIRKFKSLSQEEFGQKLGIQKSAVSKIERGENGLSEGNRIAICREFGVSEEWLKTGRGKMFVQAGTFSLNKWFREQGLTDLEIEIIKLYLGMPLDLRKEVVNYFQENLNYRKQESVIQQSPAPPPTLEKAQKAAELTGESVDEFVARAVETQARQDRATIATGINPATNRDRWAQRKNPHDMTREEMHALLDQQLDAEKVEREKRTDESDISGRGNFGTGIS